MRGGEATLAAAERGEGIASLRQPPEQMFATAQAAADAFSEINSPNENSSKEYSPLNERHHLLRAEIESHQPRQPLHR